MLARMENKEDQREVARKVTTGGAKNVVQRQASDSSREYGSFSYSPKKSIL